jgi:hypothetical protein
VEFGTISHTPYALSFLFRVISPGNGTFKKIKQIPREEHVLPGTALCAGCGGLEALRLAAKVLGDDVVYVNAAGCFTMLAAYPFTPFKGSWLYTTMGSAPAGAQGVRDALDVLIAKGRLPEREEVVVLGETVPPMTWRSIHVGPSIGASIFIILL